VKRRYGESAKRGKIAAAARCYDRSVRFTIDFERLPEAVRGWFLGLPEGLGVRRFFQANEYLNAYVDRLAAGHLDALDGATPAHPEHATWIVRKLERAGLLETDPWGRVVRRRAPDESAAEVAATALAEIPELAPSFALIDAARAGYDDFLRGKKSGAEILLTPGTLPVWQGYFDGANFGYAANNAVAASLVARAIQERAPTRPVRILELGGGFGSAAESVVSRIAPRIGRYVFTEVFPYFLGSAKRRLTRAFPATAFDFVPLDVNRPFAEQEAAPAGADVVVAVNVLHVSRHLGRTLAEVRALLAPGGTLVMVEAVRPAPGVPIYVDYPFQLLDEFFRIEDAGPERPHGGFLTVRDWRRLLKRAGLSVVAELPDHDEIEKWYSCYHLVGIAATAAE